MTSVEHPELVPRPGMSKSEMKELQREIGEKAVFADERGFSGEREVVVGVDQGFVRDLAVSAVAVLSPEGVEYFHAVAETEVPYIPGLLSFREGPVILDALRGLDRDPDLIVFDGSGRIHFRQAGIATHIGVVLDVPSVGVTKNLLCGSPARDFGKLNEGSKIPVYPDDSVEEVNDGVIGYVYQSKQYEGNRHVNPLYVSPGHGVSAETAVRAVERLVEGYKLPEPVRLADQYAEEVARDL